MYRQRSTVVPVTRAELRNSIHIEPIMVSPTDPFHSPASSQTVPSRKILPTSASLTASVSTSSDNPIFISPVPITNKANAISINPNSGFGTTHSTGSENCDVNSTADAVAPVAPNTNTHSNASSPSIEEQQGTRSASVGELYGTRLSTVVLIKRDGEVLFVERDVWQLDDRNQDWDADPASDGSAIGESGVRGARSTRSRKRNPKHAIRRGASSERLFRFRLQQ